jgi:hypothetical protein
MCGTWKSGIYTTVSGAHLAFGRHLLDTRTENDDLRSSTRCREGRLRMKKIDIDAVEKRAGDLLADYAAIAERALDVGTLTVREWTLSRITGELGEILADVVDAYRDQAEHVKGDGA